MMRNGVPSEKTEADVLADVRREAYGMRGKSYTEKIEVEDALNSAVWRDTARDSPMQWHSTPTYLPSGRCLTSFACADHKKGPYRRVEPMTLVEGTVGP